MCARQSTVPGLWLVSDARNDAGLEAAIARLPRGAGVIFRHYHLSPGERRARFTAVRRACRRRGLMLALAASEAQARRWGAGAAYAAPEALGRPSRLVRLATAHDARELAQAKAAGADAALLSPVYATRSHPAARPLGPLRFRLLAAQARLPVIALGGMNRARARALAAWGWAAIDGLSATKRRDS